MKVKCLNLDAAEVTVVILNVKDASELGVMPSGRIVVSAGKKKITAIVNVSKSFVRQGELVVYDEVKKILGLKTGNVVNVAPCGELESKKYIMKKIDGIELDEKEMRCIVNDVIQRNLNDLELAAFITALHIRGMTLDENYAMSKAMIATSNKMKFPGTVVDKHSLGGVPGDKTSMLLVPIIASTGLTIPKTSSRSITSPAGTADRMEVLAPVEHRMKDIERIVKKTGGCLVWGGAVDLAPADDLFIQKEHPLSLDPLLIASVLSKKKVAGSKYVIIDIPVGPEAKIETLEKGKHLAHYFIMLGKELGINVDCALTKADEPVGYGIGPALEAREVLENLMNIKTSEDLVDKVTSLAGSLLQMVNKGDKKTALAILKSGKAEKKMREIIKAQGGNPHIRPDDIPYAKYKAVIKSDSCGIVSGISNKLVVSMANAAGAPSYKLSGLLLHKKIGDSVKRGEPLFTLYAEKKEKLSEALKIAKRSEVFSLLNKKHEEMLIEKVE